MTNTLGPLQLGFLLWNCIALNRCGLSHIRLMLFLVPLKVTGFDIPHYYQYLTILNYFTFPVTAKTRKALMVIKHVLSLNGALRMWVQFVNPLHCIG